MKTPSSHRARAFTLVELLVVISIIAVLASAGFTAGNAAIQKAKKTTCLATCVALEGAVNNFFTEYGMMPSDGTNDTLVRTDGTNGSTELLKTLLGLTEAAPIPKNTRAIKFLSVREGKANATNTGGKNGLIYDTTGTTVTGLYDPWGGGYNVMMDCAYNEYITVTPKGSTTATRLNGRRCAVWSDGADGVTSPGKIADDVKTW